MIEPGSGNILEADAEALVNTVNCVGAMGKGIALQFKQAYPENFVAYRKACAANQVRPGRMFVSATGSVVNPLWIINFPTKRHWRGRAHMEDIQAGLEALVVEVKSRGIRSIAVPALGCGLGGLNWNLVRPLIEQAFNQLSEVRVLLFGPAQAPAPATRPIGTPRPSLTPARSLLVKAMELYLGCKYRLTQLEIQKLAYFLQEAGEPLRLRFQAGPFGPYADNLNMVLERLEGHHTRGFTGSRGPDVEIELLPGAVEEADRVLSQHEKSSDHLKRTAQLIEGFETPYGMELLSSVHWVATHRQPKAEGFDAVLQAIGDWNDRKKNLLKPEHLRVAWMQLSDQGWLYP